VSEQVTAPAAVRLVRDFVNTFEPQVDEETLTGPDRLADWLTGHGLLPAGGRLGAADLALAVTIRAGLRAVLLGHAGHPADPTALADLDRALARVPVRLTLAAGAPRLLPAGSDPGPAALAGLVEAIRRCAEERTWYRLKVCARDSCRWAFYDASRNQVRRWCSMAGCGNHVKMRRAYAARTGRRRAADPRAQGGPADRAGPP
jgi:predicted RNA-binding Zn ribbon-like protein